MSLSFEAGNASCAGGICNLDPHDNSPALATYGLNVRIKQKTVLADVNIEVHRGEWTTLVGPNGAGKSTLLRCMAQLCKHQGDVVVNGVPLASFSLKERARAIAYAPQLPHTPDSLSVYDYVMLGRTPHMQLVASESDEDLEVVAITLNQLGLNHMANRRVETLSGGERQRVVLAQALVQDASILLLDEPTTSLDIGKSQEILELIDNARIQKNLTVIMSLHDLTLACQYSDRVALLHQGTIVSSGTPSEVLTENSIALLYGASVEIYTDESNGFFVLPRRSVSTNS